MSEPEGIILTERMDWDNMRVFRIVAELGSMNAAAHRLQESAPTIGRKIDQLEEDLNTVLLVRTRRGVELTDAGRIALSHIHAMAESVGEVFEYAGNRDRDVEGREHRRSVAVPEGAVCLHPRALVGYALQARSVDVRGSPRGSRSNALG